MPAITRRGITLTAMIFAVAMTFIDQTIVSVAAPQIQAESRTEQLRPAVGHQLLPARAGRALRVGRPPGRHSWAATHGHRSASSSSRRRPRCAA